MGLLVVKWKVSHNMSHNARSNIWTSKGDITNLLPCIERSWGSKICCLLRKIEPSLQMSVHGVKNKGRNCYRIFICWAIPHAELEWTHMMLESDQEAANVRKYPHMASINIHMVNSISGQDCSQKPLQKHNFRQMYRNSSCQIFSLSYPISDGLSISTCTNQKNVYRKIG